MPASCADEINFEITLSEAEWVIVRQEDLPA